MPDRPDPTPDPTTDPTPSTGPPDLVVRPIELAPPPATTASLHRAWAPDLTPAQLYALLRLRVEVFVVEQACPYAELDGRDLEPDARHHWLDDGTTVLGGLRLLVESDGTFRLGRLCTAAVARGRGLGRRLMESGLAEVGEQGCVLDAQEHLAGFYAGFGFTASGPVYDWDGVAHLPMRRG